MNCPGYCEDIILREMRDRRAAQAPVSLGQLVALHRRQIQGIPTDEREWRDAWLMAGSVAVRASEITRAPMPTPESALPAPRAALPRKEFDDHPI